MPAVQFLWGLLALALLIPGRALYAALYLLGSIYLLARFSVQTGLQRLEIERNLSDHHIFLGEEVRVTLRFRNPLGMPLHWVQYGESRPVGLAPAPFSGILSLPAGQLAEVSYTLLGSRRGRFALGPLGLSAGDPFGLSRFELVWNKAARLTVYPRVSPLPELGLPARLPLGDLATRRRLFEDPAWLSGTRPYAPGDSLKRIHWKGTARSGEMVVKQFRHAMLLPCCVAVNLNRSDYDRRSYALLSELAVTAAASLMHHLVDEKQQVALLVLGCDPEFKTSPSLAAGPTPGPAQAPTSHSAPVRLPLQQGRRAELEALELLARIAGTDQGDFARAVAAESQQLPWGTLFCLIVPRETPEVAALCTRLSHGGQQVLLFLLDGETGRRPHYQAWALSETPRGEVVVR